MLTKSQIQRIRSEMKKDESRLPIIFNALGDICRFRIVKILLGRRDICVSDVAKILNITVSAASQQFRILEMTGLVKKQRMGQMICYELKKDNFLLKTILVAINQNEKVEKK